MFDPSTQDPSLEAQRRNELHNHATTGCDAATILDVGIVQHIQTGWGSVSVGLRRAPALAGGWLRVGEQGPAESDSDLGLKRPAVWCAQGSGVGRAGRVRLGRDAAGRVPLGRDPTRSHRIAERFLSSRLFGCLVSKS